MNAFVLDFDGVICDSATETAVSAWRAGRAIWPDWRGDEPPPDWLARFRRLRPVIETGYQTIPLMRLIQAGVPEAEVLARFPDLCREVMTACGRSGPELVRLFAEARDRWMAHDLGDWLGRHRVYPGVAAALRREQARSPLVVLSTKQTRFAQALLEANRIPVPPEHVFGLESGRPKEATLADLVRADGPLAGAAVHFVEDRLETLERVLDCPHLEAVRLYLADWGYNTAAERQRAAASPRIRVWSLATFLQVA